MRGGDRSVLIGREAELNALQGMLDAARSGERPAVALVGEPGIGKTRLLSELCDRAETAGFEILAGRGSELEREAPFGLAIDAFDEPFAALASTLPRLGDERLAELAALLPSVARPVSGSASTLEAERYRSHQAVRAVLDELAARRPVLIALDDVHWADPASLELISHLLRRGTRRTVLALAYRAGHAPAGLVRAVESDALGGGVRSLELGPLSAREAAELLGDDLDAPRVQALYEESGGNPFYLEQLSRSSEHRGEAESRTAAPDPPLDSGLPSAVGAAIAGELSLLSSEAHRLLQAGAVAGEPFELDLAAAIAGFDDARAEAAMHELIAVDLLRRTSVPRQVAFRHPIVRRAVYEAASHGWRLGAHQRAARALAARGPIGALAHHVERSAMGGDENAIEILTEAGQTAAARAPAAAARWFEAALRLLPPTAKPERRLSLLVALATALAAVGRLGDCRSALSRALEQLPASASVERGRIIAAIARTDQGLGRIDEPRRLLHSVLADAEPGSAQQSEVKIHLAENHLMAGEWQEAAAMAEEAYTQAGELRDRGLMLGAGALGLFVSNFLDSIAGSVGRIDAIAAGIDRLRDDEVGPSLLESLANLHYAEIAAERWEPAAGHAERGIRLCRASGQSYLFVRFMLGLAGTRLWQGRLSEGRRAADEAAEGSLLLGNDQLLAACEAQRCWVASIQGEVATALACGEVAVAAAERVPDSLFAWLARVCYGEALIDAGEQEPGRDQILAAGGAELADVPPNARPRWYRFLAEADLAAGRIEPAEAMAQRAEESIGAHGFEVRAGEAQYARACVLLQRGDVRAAAEHARRAADSFEAGGAPVEAARGRALVGQALALASDRAAARHELELAHSALEARGATRLADRAAKELRGLGKGVARRSAPSYAAAAGLEGLTAREREVAELVANGDTNRQIAERLYLSVKTVEAHVSHILSKLELRSRSAVSAAIERRRLTGGAHDR